MLKVFLKAQAKGPTYILGDFNARIISKLSNEEACLGNFIFDKNMDTHKVQSKDSETNRTNFVTFCCSNEILVVGCRLVRWHLPSVALSKIGAKDVRNML